MDSQSKIAESAKELLKLLKLLKTLSKSLKERQASKSISEAVAKHPSQSSPTPKHIDQATKDRYPKVREAASKKSKFAQPRPVTLTSTKAPMEKARIDEGKSVKEKQDTRDYRNVRTTAPRKHPDDMPKTKGEPHRPEGRIDVAKQPKPKLGKNIGELLKQDAEMFAKWKEKSKMLNKEESKPTKEPKKRYEDCDCESEHKLGICRSCKEHAEICPDNGSNCCGHPNLHD